MSLLNELQGVDEELARFVAVLRALATATEATTDLPGIFNKIRIESVALIDESARMSSASPDWFVTPIVEALRNVEGAAASSLVGLNQAALDRFAQTLHSLGDVAQPSAAVPLDGVMMLVQDIDIAVREVGALFRGSDSAVDEFLREVEAGLIDTVGDVEEVVGDASSSMEDAFEEAVSDVELDFDSLSGAVDTAMSDIEDVCEMLQGGREALAEGEESAQGALGVATDIVRNTQDCVQQIL